MILIWLKRDETYFKLIGIPSYFQQELGKWN